MCTPECHLLKVRMSIYRIFHGKCARTVFTHELLMYPRNQTRERSEQVRFLIQLSLLFCRLSSIFFIEGRVF